MFSGLYGRYFPESLEIELWLQKIRCRRRSHRCALIQDDLSLLRRRLRGHSRKRLFCDFKQTMRRRLGNQSLNSVKKRQTETPFYSMNVTLFAWLSFVIPS